jgi:hypothetical protein
MGSRMRLEENLEVVVGVHKDDIKKVADAIDALQEASDKFSDELYQWDTMGANKDVVVDKLRLLLRGLSIHVDNIAISRSK